MSNDIVLALVIITGLSFDFTNGFHDTANAMATSIATRALSPRIAVALSAVLNLVGAFLSLSVAATIASGLVQTGLVTLTVVFGGLAGAIVWNLITWLSGIPSSSSHALIGGVIGSMLAAAGSHAVKWQGLVSKVIIPAVLSPFIAALVATTGTFLIYLIARSMREAGRSYGFRIGQIGSASLVSLAHGTNDAQKTMGIITLALIANGTLCGIRLGRCHPAVHALRLLAVHDTGGDRVHRRPAHLDRHLLRHLLAVARYQGGSQERQLGVDRHGRPVRTRLATPAESTA